VWVVTTVTGYAVRTCKLQHKLRVIQFDRRSPFLPNLDLDSDLAVFSSKSSPIRPTEATLYWKCR